MVSLTTTQRQVGTSWNGLEALVWYINTFFVPKIIGPHLAPILFCFDLKFANFNCFFHSWIRLEKIFKKWQEGTLKKSRFLYRKFFQQKASRIVLKLAKYILLERHSVSMVPLSRKQSTYNLTWDQALFSFRFENYIPAGTVAVRENVWEPLKLGLISGYV